MKKEINFSKIITFSIIFSIIGTACGRLDEKGVSTNSADDSLTVSVNNIHLEKIE